MATFSHQGSTFISNFLVIKLLDHATYGKYSLINLTAFYAATILQFAVGSTVPKFVARYADDPVRIRSVVWIGGAFTFASGLLGFGILALSSGVLARSAFVEPSLTRPLMIVSLAVPSLIGMVYLGGLLQGLHDFRSLAASSIVSGVLFIAIVTAGAWTGDLTRAIWALVAGSTLRSVILGCATLAALKGRAIGRGFSWCKVPNEITREIFKFQIPAGLAGFVTLPTLWLIPTILTRNTQNFSDVALYSVIIMIKTLIVIPASVVSLALQPSAERAHASGQFDLAMRVFRTSTLGVFTIAAAAAIFFAVFAKEVMAVFGRSFTVASFELQLMMVAAIAEAVAVSLYMRIQAASRMWGSIFATLLPRDLAMLAIVAAFTTKYGLLAAVTAHVVGAIINLIGVYWLSMKSMGQGTAYLDTQLSSRRE
ncbi:Membrane protein involved in the export of O-antigen and teichoic acid [Bradyrhizobium erythrophlei]|uniref:Membrane protein involved in the export of O-antigen and teichoic acid n=1 Tax=Bradyrhizobium erythrophlei TaxID=1437360 RepID=A0A1M5V7R3_9BRAD|nr:Membrane protein involved in the export of O-antigen and teichoic acid [Bradyrhizobium erythrophlei]